MFGAHPFAGAPFAGNTGDSGSFIIQITLNIVFPVSMDFFGNIGDVTPLPPNLDLPPNNMNHRRSPCLLYDN